MMRRPKSNKPTDSECLILNVLWQKKSATVREIFEHLEDFNEGMGYTTVLKFMQIMTDKGLLERNSDVRPQVYRPRETRQKTQRTLVADLLDRAFNGSPGHLALQALAMRKSTPEELKEIRKMLDKMEEAP
jgi:predicted transcriptional regulator